MTDPKWPSEFYRSLFWDWPNPLNYYTKTNILLEEEEEEMIQYLCSSTDEFYVYWKHMSVEDNMLNYIKIHYTEHFRHSLIEWVKKRYLNKLKY